VPRADAAVGVVVEYVSEPDTYRAGGAGRVAAQRIGKQHSMGALFGAKGRVS